nr:hypothetical protein [Tanacetum cinerariifolium]
MANLTFVDSHNMVAYLEKSTENADFAEIVDFLNDNPIRQGKDFSGRVTPLFETMLIQHPTEVGECSTQPTKPQHTPTTASPSHIEPILTVASSQPKKTKKIGKQKKATEISQSSGPTTLIADETVHEERGDKVERAVTTAASLDAEQDSGTINRTQSTAMPNELIPQGTGSGGSRMHQDTILGDRHAQTRFERLSKQSHEPPLLRVNTLESREDSMQLMELMALGTTLSDRVLALEYNKTTQDLEITHLKKREDASKQRRNDQDEGISFVQEDAETHGRYGHNIEVNTSSTSITTANINLTAAEPVTTVKAPVTTADVPSTPPPLPTTLIEDEDLTIAQTLMKIKSVKSKEKSKEKGVSSTRLTRRVIIKEASKTASRPIFKNKSFKEVQTVFDNTKSWINSFEPMDKKVVKDRAEGSETKAEGSSKRTGEELESDKFKWQKLDKKVKAEVDNDQDEADMKMYMKIVLDDEVEIDAIPLATKPPIIVDWKIIKEGKITSYHIIRADGSSKRPEEPYERVLWGDLKVTFEPDIEKKRYLLTPATITDMLNRRLPVDHWNEIKLLSVVEVTATDMEVTTAVRSIKVGINKGQNSSSAKSINNDALVIGATPLYSIYPSNIVENVADSDDPSYGEDEKTLVGPCLPPHLEANKTLKILGKRKVAGESSTPLDVDSDSNIHEFPSAKELRDAIDCHWVVVHVTPSSWKKHLREINIEQLYDIHNRAYMRHVVLDNVKEVYEALQDLDKNPLVSDMRAEIKVLQIQVDGLHSIKSERERLKSFEIQLLQEIDSLKQDRADVVSKVILKTSMKLVRSDDLEPFVLKKTSCYRPSLKKEYDHASDALANASYPFLAEYVINLYASLEQLLLKKPPSLRPILSGSRSKPLSLKVK